MTTPALPRFSPFDARDDDGSLLLVRPRRRGESMQRWIKRVAVVAVFALGVLLCGFALSLPEAANVAVGLGFGAICIAGAGALLYWLGRFGVRGVRIGADEIEILGTGFAGRATTRKISRSACTGLRLLPLAMHTRRGTVPGWRMELQTSEGPVDLGRIVQPPQDAQAPGRFIAERLGVRLDAPA